MKHFVDANKKVGMSDREDEVWTTRDGREIEVGNMTEAHAKNALRMMLRKRRRVRELEQESADLEAADLGGVPPEGCDEYGSLDEG